MKTINNHRLARPFPPSPSCFAAQGGWSRHCAQLRNALVLAAAVVLVHDACAQSWYTVDDFQYSPGTNAFATGLAKDPTGAIIYSAGDAQDASGVWHGFAWKSADGGSTWSLMNDYVDPASPSGSGVGYDAGIAADSFGNLYAAGYDGLPSNVEAWFTRSSTDGGLTWSTVDTFGNTSVARPTAMATDSAGNVYVVGQLQTNAAVGGYVWIVRKATGGTNWATVAQSGAQTNNPAWTANGVFCHSNAGVFVVGQGLGPAQKSGGQTVYPNVWTVRRSRDGGATWATVDSFQFVQKNVLNTARAYGAGADFRGNLYVVGYASSQSGGLEHSDHWIVRKSPDGGNSWSTVDDFVTSTAITTSSPTPQAFGCDTQGNLFVAGNVRFGPTNGTEPATKQWLVRESAGGTSSWQTVDTFQYVAGGDSAAYALTCDSSDHVYVAGFGPDVAGVEHWLVRKH